MKDVKTLLGIIPFLICMAVVFILVDEINPYHYVEHSFLIKRLCDFSTS